MGVQNDIKVKQCPAIKIPANHAQNRSFLETSSFDPSRSQRHNVMKLEPSRGQAELDTLAVQGFFSHLPLWLHSCLHLIIHSIDRIKYNVRMYS